MIDAAAAAVQGSYLVRAAHEGCQLPCDRGVDVEARYFVQSLLTPEVAAMIRSSFSSVQELNRGAGRPAIDPRWRFGNLPPRRDGSAPGHFFSNLVDEETTSM